MMTDGTVDILLSTYNGSHHLPELLDSIGRQTCREWRLLVRDDGSADSTADILRAWGDRHPDRFRLLSSPTGNLGPAASFSVLAGEATAPHMMFCDQDDVWLDTRIERCRSGMAELEKRHDRSTPLLLYSDLRVVDDQLVRLDDSFFRYQNLHPGHTARFRRCLVQNVVPGCAMMLNRALRDLAIPVPPDAVMHDWWVVLVAAGLGVCKFQPEPALLYRQHLDSHTGARPWGAGMLRQALSPAGRNRDGRAERRKAQEQAAALLTRHGGRLAPIDRAACQAYAAFPRSSALRKRVSLVRHGLWKSGWMRNVCFILTV